jgi:hypothetical protein
MAAFYRQFLPSKHFIRVGVGKRILMRLNTCAENIIFPTLKVSFVGNQSFILY